MTSTSARRTASFVDPTQTGLSFPTIPADERASPFEEEHVVERQDKLAGRASSVGAENWRARSRSRDQWSSSHSFNRSNHQSRQKSLGEALHIIRDRRGSVSDNAHEIAEALKAPVSLKLVVLCGIWYLTSTFSSASSKVILVAFRKPVTLTLVQFAFVSGWCLFSSAMAQRYPVIKTYVPALKYSILPPTKELIVATLPMAGFQIGGHILNSDALSRVPVSLVHTIKGLSPLITVMAYRILFRVHYSIPTYLSLIPLTLGVIMACSADFTSNYYGLLCSFASALLFVTQNIVSKRIFNDAALAEAEGTYNSQANRKPDKLNLLCYSSGMALVATLPIWLWSEGFELIREVLFKGAVDLSEKPGTLDHGSLILEFIFNGTFHFGQCLMAFVLLSMVSPVTYSIASLMKRVFVITFAIFWFGNPISRLQGFGIALTFIGLYLYDRTNDSARADRRARALDGREKPLLPVASQKKTDKKTDRTVHSTPTDYRQTVYSPSLTTSAESEKSGEDHQRSNATQKRGSSVGHSSEYRPGTRQEDTWKSHDTPKSNGVAT